MLMDTGYKLLFSHPRLIRDLLMQFVPVIQPETLDFASLRRVNGEFVTAVGQRRGDMIWKVRLSENDWVYIYLLLEFQSGIDRWMALRMQAYVLGLFDDLLSQNEIVDGKLPPVLPIVLYNGASRWDAATDLAALQGLVPTNLQQFQPTLKYWLIDRGAQNAASLDRSNLVTLLFSLEHARADEISGVIAELTSRLADTADTTLRHNFAVFATWLLRRKTKDSNIPDMADLAEVQNMLMERRLDWWEEWMNEGHAKGLAEGVVRGEAKMLQAQLVRKFRSLPHWMEPKLAAATETDLVRWGERLVEAATLEDVFAD